MKQKKQDPFTKILDHIIRDFRFRPIKKIMKDAIEIFFNDRRLFPAARQKQDPFVFGILLMYPETETCLIGGDGGDAIGGAFQRGVAPWFIIRGEDAQIASG